ncbi:MAG: HD domain-containing protein [Lachnospiraceae bacterium]|nr:HD domain-containing protein [Lachnospiraceae bacterium]
MAEFWLSLQLNIMLALSGICCAMAFLLLMTKVLTPKRKAFLVTLELSTFFILIFEHQAYMYEGEPGTTAYVMVCLGNFVVFFLNTVLSFVFNLYVWTVLIEDAGENAPKRLKAAAVFAILSGVFLIINLFTGWIYSVDASNMYHRGALFIINYLFVFMGPILDLTVVVQYRKKISKKLVKSFLLFIIVPIAAGIIQAVKYGVSLISMSLAVVSIFLYTFAYEDINDKVVDAKDSEVEHLKINQSKIENLFEQTIKAFVNAIDARVDYAEGHSVRVADYAYMLAQMNGKSEEECKDIYQAALLHDVGKIGIPDEILKKDSDLTEEEVDTMRQEPLIGERILSGISGYPGLLLGAKYHMERYDGSGFPVGLKGNEIPEAARIIAIAECYDSMTTRNSYREPLPQSVVREEFIKESGYKYDPLYTGIMLQLIDSDVDYQMKEETENVDTIFKNEFSCDEFRSAISYGIRIRPEKKIIAFSATPINEDEPFSSPAIIVFDSMDERVHDTDKAIKDTRYVEFGEVWFDGHFVCSGARNIKLISLEKIEQDEDETYFMEIARNRDHVQLKLEGKGYRSEVVLALPDSSKYAYIGLTGENCHISSIEVEKTNKRVPEDEIPRIAEEINYINRLESDIPNVQVDSVRSDYTEGVLIKDGMRMIFHTMSLPSANLVWHCPYLLLYTSDDMKVMGRGYKEYALIRLDGEVQGGGDFADNKTEVEKGEDFTNWESWKKLNRKGFECTVGFAWIKNKLITETVNGGISITNITTVHDKNKKIYVAITGDQVALTDIRIKK